jgi:hypothetical protein
MMAMRFAASKGGAAAYSAGAPLSANPYVPGCVFARLWADSWLNTWMKGA